MPIVEFRIDKIEPQRPGRIRVHEYFRNHVGFETTNIYDVPDNYDTARHLVDAVVFRDGHMIESEASAVEARVLEGEDPNTITINHITVVQKVKAIILALMRGRAQQVFKAAVWLDANVTDAQLNRRFGRLRRIKIRNRIISVLALRTALEADETMRDG
jgi:transcriptional regulator of heat shock response